jgi:hypothetical protein
MAQPFDVRRLALNGDAFPVAEQIQLQGIQPAQSVFTVSESGVLVYQTGAVTAGRQLIWFDRTSKPLATVGDQATYADVALSPDGKRAVVYVGAPGDLWTVDLARGLRTRFTFNQAVLEGSPSGLVMAPASHSRQHPVRKPSPCTRRRRTASARRNRCSRTTSRNSHQTGPPTDGFFCTRRH